MPMYEYKCEKCGLRVEALASIDDRDHPLKCKCPDGKDSPQPVLLKRVATPIGGILMDKKTIGR